MKYRFEEGMTQVLNQILEFTQEKATKIYVSVLIMNLKVLCKEERNDKINFMGTPDFSATVLKGLLADSRYEILAVVTQPDRKVGRKKDSNDPGEAGSFGNINYRFFSRRNYRVVQKWKLSYH